VDGSVAERRRQRLVHQPVLVDQRQAGEPRRGDDNLKVVTRAGPVLNSRSVSVAIS